MSFVKSFTSFPVWMPVFPSCLTALPGIPSTRCWTAAVKVSVLVFSFLMVGEGLPSFTTECDISYGFVLKIIFMLRKFASSPSKLSAFIVRGCSILSNAFPASIKMITWFFSFVLLIWYITLIGFRTLNDSYTNGINLTWSRCIILLTCFWTQFACISVRSATTLP